LITFAVMRTRAYILLFSLLSSVISAQKIRFDQYTVKQGLLSEQVYNLHQDQHGYLWVFTNYGVLKYNSVSFKQVLRNLPFSESFIYSCFERDDKMWVANSMGRIYMIRNDSAFQVSGTEKISETLRKNIMEIYQLFVDDSLNIYAITKHYTYRFDRQNDYKPINLSRPPDDSVNYKFHIKQGGIFPVFYFNGNDSVFCGGHQRLTLKVCDSLMCSSTMSVPCAISNIRQVKKFGSTVYFSHHQSLGRIINNKLTEIPLEGIILNFTQDKYGHTWVACNKDGLYELDEKDSVINHYFENITVNDVLVDFQDGLWVSTSGQGLFHCRSLNDKYFSENSGLGKPINFIRQFGDALYIGTGKGELYRLRNGKYEVIYSQHRDNDPIDIAIRDSTLLLVSRLSTELFSLKKTTLNDPVVISNSLSAISVLAQGVDTLIFLKRKSIVWMVRGKIVKTIALYSKAHNFTMYRNKLLVATDNGVWELSDNQLLQPDYLLPTQTYVISSIRHDFNDNLWLCSIGGGLFRLTGKNDLQRFTTFDGLPGNIINEISFTQKGEVLLCVNKGLYYSLYNSTLPKTWFRLSHENTYHALVFNNQAYASTNSGLVIFDLKSKPGVSFHFNLNSIYISKVPISVQKLGNLNHTQNNLQFRFDLISYTDDKFNPRYKLAGPYQDSGSVELNEILFQRLPPGDYTLTVQPVKNSTAGMISIPFRINPAFWQTGLFGAFAYIVLVGGIILLTRYFINRYKQKEIKRNEANRLILEYRLIALKAQINPHFMSNCLTAIQHLIINNKLEEATAYVAKFGLLVRQILNFSTKPIITLKEELAIAKLNMELEQLRFEKKFRFEIRVEEGLDTRQILVPALLLNPIIENAIWHGLLPLESTRQGVILISAELRDEAIQISIVDNGVGRQVVEKKFGNTKESKGLNLTRQRLSNINNLFNSSLAGIRYSDVESGGTTVTITLPLNLQKITNEQNQGSSN
jgi:ligand-binding sensor domain-containing protein/anti-sigma regulatory factor (Ser/Thr protein kinase)